jgi:hypothetical protein
MGRHIKLKEAALALTIALSLATIGGAMAFQAETVPSPQPQGDSKAAPLTPFGQQLSVPGKASQQIPNDPLAITGADKGTEVTIPGIGSVGKLPKLDFGLELLYGTKDAPEALQISPEGFEQRSDELPGKPDMQIKGTLRHKF